MASRRLPRGSWVPLTPPARYRTSDGYVLLRWRVAKGEYVEALEHRVVDGRIVDSESVHHRNHVRTDNALENLAPLSKSEHGRAHAVTDRQAVAAAYRSGCTTIEIARQFSTHPGNVSRILAEVGVPIRPVGKRRRDVNRVEALRLIREGVPIGRIARQMGCSHGVIDAVRIANGIPSRREGHP